MRMPMLQFAISELRRAAQQVRAERKTASAR
jgi:hypothetical protein